MLNYPNYFSILSNCFCFNSAPTNGLRPVTAILPIILTFNKTRQLLDVLWLSKFFILHSIATNGLRIVTSVLPHGNLVSRQARGDGSTRFRIVHLLLLETTKVDWRISKEGRSESGQGRLELRGFHADGSEQYHVEWGWMAFFYWILWLDWHNISI